MDLPPLLQRLARSDRRIGPLVDRVRTFRTQCIDPIASDLDRALLLDPEEIPQGFLADACRFGLLSLPIPTFLGGGGLTPLHLAVALEELSSGCAGLANILGAHYLGLSPLLLSLDLHHFDEMFAEVVACERRGEARLFAAAITEPTAGTDVEDAELLPKARVGMAARKVEGGYRLSGRKVFISNGSIASYHTVVCALDRARPLETWTAFVVPSRSPGLSVGRVERKMGQRACAAAELVFEDCFVPDRHRLGTEGRAMAMTGVVLAASRAPVAAIATGIARGAYERALRFVSTRGPEASPPLSQTPWVQQTLADLSASIEAARALYLQAALYFDETVTRSLLGHRWALEALMRLAGPLRRSRPGRALTSSEPFKRWMTGRVLARTSGPEVRRSLGLSSQAKFTASDLAVEVCLKALALCGSEGADERIGIEKHLRDAKLTQIYEGTNQLNRRAAYQNLIEGGPSWAMGTS